MLSPTVDPKVQGKILDGLVFALPVLALLLSVHVCISFYEAHVIRTTYLSKSRGIIVSKHIEGSHFDEGGKSILTYFRFTDASGIDYTVKNRNKRSEYRLFDSIEVIYNAHDPRKAVLNVAPEIRGNLYALLGSLAVVIALNLIIVTVRKRAYRVATFGKLVKAILNRVKTS